MVASFKIPSTKLDFGGSIIPADLLRPTLQKPSKPCILTGVCIFLWRCSWVPCELGRKVSMMHLQGGAREGSLSESIPC